MIRIVQNIKGRLPADSRRVVQCFGGCLDGVVTAVVPYVTTWTERRGAPEVPDEEYVYRRVEVEPDRFMAIIQCIDGAQIPWHPGDFLSDDAVQRLQAAVCLGQEADCPYILRQWPSRHRWAPMGRWMDVPDTGIVLH